MFGIKEVSNQMLSILLFKGLLLFETDFFFVLKYPYIPMFK